jgi:serine/threonine-protein kinase
MDGLLAAARAERALSLAKYDVLEEIGHGGMATVYRAHDRRLARDVALKVIHPHLRDSREVAHRFFVEAKAVAKLRHENIVEVYDVSDESEAEKYLVVELVRGVTLREMLRRDGPLPPEVAAAIGLELLHALAHAHGEGVIHRDIKPENVLLEHRPLEPRGELQEGLSEGSGGGVAPVTVPANSDGVGTRVRVKLTDFGIAKLLDAQGVTSTGQVLGSPAHMAPEQIEGRPVDARADVFGLGVLLYECMVGHLPFEGANPAQVLRRVLDGIYPPAERERATVGKRWSAILDRALAHDPDARFADAAAMREALLAELARVGIKASRPELEAWCDDPSTYRTAHGPRMIEALCAVGAEAQRTGRALDAAADLNRALAYAPDDPRLCKLVAGLRQAESRKRLLRLGARVGLVALAGVALAFVGSRVVERAHGEPLVARGVARFVAPLAAPVKPSSASDGAASALVEAPSRDPKVPSRPTLPTMPAPPRTAPARPVSRDLVFGSVRPPFGVVVSVDGGPPVDARAGVRIPVDGQKHTLTFRCTGDLCEPQERLIAEGDRDEVVQVALTIRPAMLLVEGQPQHTYRVVQEPQLPLRAGVAAPVPMRSAKYPVQVVELPSNRTKTIVLTAGQEARVVFGPDEDPAP